MTSSIAEHNNFIDQGSTATAEKRIRKRGRYAAAVYFRRVPASIHSLSIMHRGCGCITLEAAA